MEGVLGLGRNTLARWETGQRPIPEYVKATFRLIALNPLAADVLRVIQLVLPLRRVARRLGV